MMIDDWHHSRVYQVTPSIHDICYIYITSHTQPGIPLISHLGTRYSIIHSVFTYRSGLMYTLLNPTCLKTPVDCYKKMVIFLVTFTE